MHACVLSRLSRVRCFATLWTVVPQAPLSMGILQARILEWVAMPSSKMSSQPWDRTPTSLTSPALAGGFFTTSASTLITLGIRPKSIQSLPELASTASLKASSPSPYCRAELQPHWPVGSARHSRLGPHLDLCLKPSPHLQLPGSSFTSQTRRWLLQESLWSTPSK